MKKKSAKKGTMKSVSKPVIKKERIQPLGDRVLVRPTREGEKKIGALIIPASGERDKPDTGTVLAVGEGKHVDGKLVAPRVKAGDRVMFSKYSYDEITLDGEELYMLREENILAVLNK